MTATIRTYLKWVCTLHFSLSAILCLLKYSMLSAGVQLPSETATGELLNLAFYIVAAGISFVLYRRIPK